jgi:hypothetical protein
MDVGYKLVDAQHGEFWLRHCGALMDVEPHGEQRVVGMCHTIEDPTFDATAYATNPRARIRPIHRPPRVPADRAPHCHWTIAIDPDNEPVGAARHTAAVAALPLARIPNPRGSEPEPAGMTDYRGRFAPDFRLGDLSSATLAAVAREFQIQCHLLSSSADLALTARFGAPKAREILEAQWIAIGWVASQRLARALGPEAGGGDALADVLRLHSALPPGFTRSVESRPGGVRLVMEPVSPGLLDPENPGWLGLIARGCARGLESLAQAVEPRAHLLASETGEGRIAADFAIEADRPLAKAPRETAFMHLSTATSWLFDTSEARLGR